MDFVVILRSTSRETEVWTYLRKKNWTFFHCQKWEALGRACNTVTSKVRVTVSPSVPLIESGCRLWHWVEWDLLWWAYLPNVTPHQTLHEGETYDREEGSCDVRPPPEPRPGGTLHTMPLHVCLPCQQCDPVSLPWGIRRKRGQCLPL